MEAPRVVATGTYARAWNGTDVACVVLLLGAILAPPSSLAEAFNATYGATPGEVLAGAWILKLSLATVALAALAVARIPLPAVSHDAVSVDHTDSRTWIILLGLVALGLGLRFYAINTELWLDEIYLRARYAPLEFRQLISTYDSQNHQPLYSILSRISWLAAAGADWSIRVPAVLFGAGSLVALWWLGRRLTSDSEALLCVAFLTVSYHHVWFSQNARGYTAILFFALVGTGVFYRLCEGQGRARSLAWTYALLMALAAYTHLTAALIVVGHLLALMFTTRWTTDEGRRAALWPVIALVLSGLLTILFYAPMLPQVLRVISEPTMEGVAVEWTGTGWMLREGLRVLSRGIPGGVVSVLVALSVLATGLASYWRQSRRATLLMFLPVVVTLAVIVAMRHNLWPRFFFFAAGFLVLAAVRGGFVVVRALVPRQAERLAVAGACAVAFLSLLTVPRAWQPKQQFRAAYEFVEGERQPGDAVIALDAAASVYSLLGLGADWQNVADPEGLTVAERSARRTWIVYTLTERVRAVSPALFRELTEPRYQVVRVFPAGVGGGEIHVLRHDSTTGHD